MKKFLAIAALALPMAAAPFVTYTTTGVFTPGSNPGAPPCAAGENCQTTGTPVVDGNGNTVSGGTLTYLFGGGTVDLAPLGSSNITFGTLNSLGNVGNLNGSTFVLNVMQTAPAADSGTFTGNLTGTVIVDSSNAFLKFTNTTLVLNGGPLGPVTYEIFQPSQGIAIVPPSTDQNGTITGGTTTIQGMVSVASIPEPATFSLIGLGLAGVGLVARRRRA